ncbi:hypothetical protein Vau01_097980 [Virgisporangium aurantiacum]|uniref:Uncharacterized protein n=1 Tax=Virgisporangium aurantiacum TaxID=175570 RepID=A0A8J3ZE09_9ACTN|nr:hypothetical protein Vau01_097980 [Virgisporangium aurantiacum]
MRAPDPAGSVETSGAARSDWQQSGTPTQRPPRFPPDPGRIQVSSVDEADPKRAGHRFAGDSSAIEGVQWT